MIVDVTGNPIDTEIGHFPANTLAIYVLPTEDEAQFAMIEACIPYLREDQKRDVGRLLIHLAVVHERMK